MKEERKVKGPRTERPTERGTLALYGKIQQGYFWSPHSWRGKREGNGPDFVQPAFRLWIYVRFLDPALQSQFYKNGEDPAWPRNRGNYRMTHGSLLGERNQEEVEEAKAKIRLVDQNTPWRWHIVWEGRPDGSRPHPMFVSLCVCVFIDGISSSNTWKPSSNTWYMHKLANIGWGLEGVGSTYEMCRPAPVVPPNHSPK